MTLFNNLLINLSIRPYKVENQKNQLLVKYYRNGRLKATRIRQKSNF